MSFQTREEFERYKEEMADAGFIWVGDRMFGDLDEATKYEEELKEKEEQVA